MTSIENGVAEFSLHDADTNGISTYGTDAKAPVNIKDEGAAQLAREKGWVVPVNYDYQAYNATLEERIAAQAKAAEGGDFAENGVTAQEAPAWASNAEKYEWNDEFGDVGPAFPALEAQLFKNDLINRVGLQFDV